jgi:hypothetical protein
LLSSLVGYPDIEFAVDDESKSTTDATFIHQSFVDKSVRFLGSEYARLIDQRLQQTSIRNISGQIDKLKGFTIRQISNRPRSSMSILRLRLDGDIPLWGVLFFALRAGKKEAFIDILNRTINNDTFPEHSSRLRRLKRFIESTYDSTMIARPEDLTANMNLREAVLVDCERLIDDPDKDPFEIGCYIVLTQATPFAKLDVEVKQLLSVWVYPTIFDYLWFRVTNHSYFSISANLSSASMC